MGKQKEPVLGKSIHGGRGFNASPTINEKGYEETLKCSKETKDLIINNCIEEFLDHHPELKGSHVTHNQILKQIAEFYLNQ